MNAHASLLGIYEPGDGWLFELERAAPLSHVHLPPPGLAAWPSSSRGQGAQGHFGVNEGFSQGIAQHALHRRLQHGVPRIRAIGQGIARIRARAGKSAPRRQKTGQQKNKTRQGGARAH